MVSSDENRGFCRVEAASSCSRWTNKRALGHSRHTNPLSSYFGRDDQHEYLYTNESPVGAAMLVALLTTVCLQRRAKSLFFSSPSLLPLSPALLKVGVGVGVLLVRTYSVDSNLLLRERSSCTVTLYGVPLVLLHQALVKLLPLILRPPPPPSFRKT